MAAQAQASPLLVVDGLERQFHARHGLLRRAQHVVRAVDGVSFAVDAGASVGIVGESGCGKTTLARCIVRLLEPDAGRVVFDGTDITHLQRTELRDFRRQIGVVFQDPFSSLDPRMSVRDIVAEPAVIAGVGSRAERTARVARLLDLVGLRADDADRHAHEFSGGQRQRIGIARALCTEPRLLVCDEPVSALDVSIQAQILNLIAGLRTELGLTLVVISHNLEVVRHLADRVLVMYLGRVVEDVPAVDAFSRPAHPYTAALRAAMLVPGATAVAPSTTAIRGDAPDPFDPPQGCAFHTRCPYVVDRCRDEVPGTTRLSDSHSTRCHFPLKGGDLPSSPVNVTPVRSRIAGSADSPLST
jgi:oligopeptide/dipeptide ABC transporter ATP-binding protein